MAEKTENTRGRHLLTSKDFAAVVDADGKDLPPVPKHWGAEQLPAGASFKKKAPKADKDSGSDGAGTPAVDPDAEPKGNASTEAWADWAKRVRGATDDDLKDADGEPLKRDEIKAKFGTTGS